LRDLSWIEIEGGHALQQEIRSFRTSPRNGPEFGSRHAQIPRYALEFGFRHA